MTNPLFLPGDSHSANGDVLAELEERTRRWPGLQAYTKVHPEVVLADLIAHLRAERDARKPETEEALRERLRMALERAEKADAVEQDVRFKDWAMERARFMATISQLRDDARTAALARDTWEARALEAAKERDAARAERDRRARTQTAIEDDHGWWNRAALDRRIAEAVAREREECARLCDALENLAKHGAGEHPWGQRLNQAARNIRARGKAPACLHCSWDGEKVVSFCLRPDCPNTREEEPAAGDVVIVEPRNRAHESSLLTEVDVHCGLAGEGEPVEVPAKGTTVHACRCSTDPNEKAPRAPAGET